MTRAEKIAKKHLGPEFLKDFFKDLADRGNCRVIFCKYTFLYLSYMLDNKLIFILITH